MSYHESCLILEHLNSNTSWLFYLYFSLTFLFIKLLDYRLSSLPSLTVLYGFSPHIAKPIMTRLNNLFCDRCYPNYLFDVPLLIPSFSGRPFIHHNTLLHTTLSLLSRWLFIVKYLVSHNIVGLIGIWLSWIVTCKTWATKFCFKLELYFLKSET